MELGAKKRTLKDIAYGSTFQLNQLSIEDAFLHFGNFVENKPEVDKKSKQIDQDYVVFGKHP